jgi:hypothetical protein
MPPALRCARPLLIATYPRIGIDRRRRMKMSKQK